LTSLNGHNKIGADSTFNLKKQISKIAELKTVGSIPQLTGIT
jgi:hypothetical protein